MKKIKTDFLVVGAGFYGCVLAERIATVLKKKVVILEKRDHIGGNCFSEVDKKTGIEFHKYGTHIFHTSNQNVWNYLKNFTYFNNYRHQVLARFKRKIYQLPINLETINSFFNKDFSPTEAKDFIFKQAKKFSNVKHNNFETKAKSQIGEKLYNAFIRDYTYKQWGKDPKKLPSSIFNRLPLRFDYNESYFKNAIIQGIPTDGYTKIFERLIESNKINISYNSDYEYENDHDVKYLTIYTGPLDKLLNNKFGKLEWRSLRFEKEIVSSEDFQGTSVINFPELRYKFTRIHEPRHLHVERNYGKKNLIIKEFPSTNSEEPYYPINDDLNRDIHRKYKDFLYKINKKFIFGGRLADYAYYDMDMTISAALKKFDQIKKNLL